MNSPQLSLKVFALYLFLLPGLGLILFPVDMFTAIGAIVPAEYDIWAIRMIGFLAFALGVYYYYMATLNLYAIFPVTVIMRIGASLFMVTLWLFGEAHISILGFAIMDFLGAIWTLVSLRNTKNPSPN